jgi:S-ribosylhomocysteine lyase
MKKIASFEVDHTVLNKGIYVSRVDYVGAEALTTFDLRMKMPNREVLGNKAIHTLEHLIATFVRNDSEYANRIIYFGPMGCLTGMYLIVQGEVSSIEILPLVKRAFDFAAHFEGEIPGVSEKECGTYLLHSLEDAKREALAYVAVLNQATDENLIYPKSV